jgi:signal transduction histidine kinase
MTPGGDIADHPARVLIVDDERQNRQLLEVMLAPEGFQLSSAASGEDAVALVALRAPDLILLDIMMPGIDGYQVAQQLKGDPSTKQIPIILISALHDRDAMMLGLAAGAEDFLTKPVHRGELCMRVRNLLRLKAYGDYFDQYSTKLREQVEELGIERDLRERFVSILAHDLRGPLSAAKMSAELMIRRTEQSDGRRDLAVRIERNLDRMDRMIRDLLDVSRVRGGQRLPLRLEDCDLGAVAREVIEELSATHGNRFELAPGDGVVRGIWSHEDLHRALWNLGTNAVKYGESERPITTRVERTPSGVRASVHNFGNPIPPDKRARLFDLYSRLREGSGTGWGLGLALVRACAEAHGGEAAIGESSEEAGTTFTIDLPSDSRPFQQEMRPV